MRCWGLFVGASILEMEIGVFLNDGTAPSAQRLSQAAQAAQGGDFDHTHI